MEITRIYYNASNATLRIDTVNVEVRQKTYEDLRLGNDPGLQMNVCCQKVETILKVSSTSLAGSRQVSNIEIIGDFDDYDDTGPSYNITWASKTLKNGQVARADMSNLPKIGDAV